MQITKFKSGLSIAWEQMVEHLQRAKNMLARLVKSLAGTHRRLQEIIREREDDLRKLLASSSDAIVVTNAAHRLVAANPRALDLFGISEANMGKFTLDAFLPHQQVLGLDAMVRLS